ncbi:hypothetical protein [Klebsiella quasipneumoniae]|uniref:hypothetical protein n=1 Tax=Klebsiella quasipneumoniae TaxID=1463165 RepID=UPI000C7BF04B|nr:hypothetical protein [Klebsiella quasipneumoniae]PLC69109.1 hypothetical protein B6I39_28530 [Klebsiella quasipneumoniae]
MNKFKLKTVDVWDTILRRNCHPDFIKRSTAYYFFLKYHDLHNINSVDQLFSKRVETEHAIGQENKALAYDDEYLIQDVMLQWVANYISAEHYDTAAIAHELYVWEMEQEKKTIYLDPDIKDFLAQYPADNTLFLSDFYTSADDLKKLLHHAGMDVSIISDGISSIDERLNKRSGKLFDFVQQKYQLSPADWVHIGDNEWSDVKMPASKGINSIRYLPTDQHHLREQKEALWHNNETLTETLINQIIQEHTKSAQLPVDFLLGLKTTPLIAGFCLKILEQAISSNSEKIFFFTREGEFFIKAFNILIDYLKANISEIKLPEIDILEVSRLATFAPSLQEISLKEMMRVWNLYSTQSVSALFKTLNIDITGFKRFIDKYDIPADEQIQYPWQDHRVQQLFDDAAFKEQLWQHVLQQRALLKAYFKTKGLHDDVDAKVCVVDVGWRGTIHDNIALLYPNIHFTGVYLGLQKFLNDQPSNTAKAAFGPDLNHQLEYPHFLDSVAPIEMITNSPSGSVTGYGEENGKLVAIRNINSDENNAWHSFTRTFQEGILAGMTSFSAAALSHGLTHEQVRGYALKVWDVLISGNNKSLTDAFNNLNHNETFGLGGYIKKNHVPSTGEILSALWNREHKKNLISFIKANQWSDGIRNRDNLSLLNKNILALTIDLAVFYKRRFYRK